MSQLQNNVSNITVSGSGSDSSLSSFNTLAVNGGGFSGSSVIMNVDEIILENF